MDIYRRSRNPDEFFYDLSDSGTLRHANKETDDQESV